MPYKTLGFYSIVYGASLSSRLQVMGNLGEKESIKYWAYKGINSADVIVRDIQKVEVEY